MFNRNRSGMFAAGNDGCDKKIINIFNQRTGTDFLRNEFTCSGNILGRDFAEYLKGTVSISTDNAKNGCNINSLKTSRVGNGDTLDILDDVAAQMHFNLFWKFSENLSGLRRCIGNGDWFCTSKSRNQFMFQDVQIVCI